MKVGQGWWVKTATNEITIQKGHMKIYDETKQGRNKEKANESGGRSGG